MNFQKVFCLGILICGTVQAMEKLGNNTESLWQQLQKEGPLASLAFSKNGEKYPGFEEVRFDSKGRILGWLTVNDQLPLGPELPEAIFVAVKLHNSGYSVTFVDKEGNKLPDGLYLWRSSDTVRLLNPAGPLYTPEKCGTSIYWYNNKRKIASKVRYWKGRVKKPAKDAFQDIPSIVNAFKGKYRVYVRNGVPHSVLIPAEKTFTYYKDMSSEEKKGWLDLYTSQDLQILTEWLEDKMESSGLSHEEMRQIAYHYLIERLVNQVFRVQADKGRSFPSVDIYDLLADIDDIVEVTPAWREAFNEHLTKDDKRDAITGYSKIACVGGMYQWD